MLLRLSEDSKIPENVSLEEDNKTLEIEGKNLKVNKDVKKKNRKYRSAKIWNVKTNSHINSEQVISMS